MPIGLITYMIVLPWSVLFFLNRCYLGNVVIHRHHTTTHDKGSFIYYVSTDLFFFTFRNPLPPTPPTTMVSVSAVQPSINLEFLTYKNLKMSVYTLFKKSNLQIFIYENLCIQLLLNDEKTHLDPCSHHDIF